MASKKKCIIIPLTDKARRLGYVTVSTMDNGGIKNYKLKDIVYLTDSEIRSIRNRKEYQKNSTPLTVYEIMEKKQIPAEKAKKVLEQLEKSDYKNEKAEEVQMYEVIIK